MADGAEESSVALLDGIEVDGSETIPMVPYSDFHGFLW